LAGARSALRLSCRSTRRDRSFVRQKPRALPAIRGMPSRPRPAGRHHRSGHDRSGDPALPGRTRPPRAMSALLEVRDLKTSFAVEAGELFAVDGVSFTLDAGRTLC